MSNKNYLTAGFTEINTPSYRREIMFITEPGRE
jgi:hypothetical protein